MKKDFLKLLLFALLVTVGHTKSIDIPILSDVQDVEERKSDGKIDNNDKNLDIVFEKPAGRPTREQLIGLRFEDIKIPKGARIDNAYIEFHAKNSDSGVTNVIVEVEASDDAPALSTTDYDVSSRTVSPINYMWDIPAWTKKNRYQSGDIKALIQTIVDRDGWDYSNAMMLRLRAGTGCVDDTCKRRASSFRDGPAKAPVLHVEYTLPEPLADYRLDECYFLGGANGVSGDIVDSSLPNYSATSVNRVDSNNTDFKICRAGAFDDSSYAVLDNTLTLGTDWTMSIWINFPFVQTGKRYYILGSYPDVGDLPVFQYKNNTTLEWGIYDNNRDLLWESIDNSLSGWHQLVFVNAGANTTLYVDGVATNSIALGTSGDVAYLWASSDDLIGQSIASNIDEMKFFAREMFLEEIVDLYTQEEAGNNYDGTIRDCPSCESAPIAAGSWELIGIPADFRSNSKTVQDIFADDMQGTFNTDWRIYERTYNSADNNGAYQQLALNDPLKFGVGYWLGSSLDERWDIDGSTTVDYNYPGPGCQGSACVEIDLEPVSKNFGDPDNDPNDGSGPYRYFYSGFIGLEKPVDWADCRFLIDGAVLTPSQAEIDGYIAKQIWLYNPTVTGADANGYTTCDDTTPGACKLLPFKGFVVELHGKTKGKTVKLLIPKE